MQTINEILKTELETAFSHFNKELELDLPMVALYHEAKKKSHGYFSPESVEQLGEKGLISRIVLNSTLFRTETFEQSCSTLVHEMIHLWQTVNGTAPRKAYHDKQFMEKMESVGLITSDTGLVGGKRTGQKMSDYVVDGPFRDACVKLVATGFDKFTVSLVPTAPAAGAKPNVWQCGCEKHNKVRTWAGYNSICQICNEQYKLLL